VNGIAEVQVREVSLYIQNLGSLWTVQGLSNSRKHPLKFSVTVHLHLKSRKAWSSVIYLTKVKAESCETCEIIVLTVSFQEWRY
jgi:hypothetical protein